MVEGQLSLVGIVLVRGSCHGAMFLGGDFQGGNCLGGHYLEVIVQGGIIQGEIFLESKSIVMESLKARQ